MLGVLEGSERDPEIQVEKGHPPEVAVWGGGEEASAEDRAETKVIQGLRTCRGVPPGAGRGGVRPVSACGSWQWPHTLPHPTQSTGSLGHVAATNYTGVGNVV